MNQLLYKGIPVNELSKEDLIQALYHSQQLYYDERKSFNQMAELASTKYKPQTWLGRLLNL